MPPNSVPLWFPIAIAVIGAVGVVSGGLLQAWRDDRRWKRERDREQERWHREDDNRWFEVRVKTYTSFFDAIEEMSGSLTHGQIIRTEKNLNQLMREAARELNHLRWVAGPRARAAAFLYWRMLSGIAMMRRYDQGSHGHDEGSQEKDDHRRALISMEPAWNEIFVVCGPDAPIKRVIIIGVAAVRNLAYNRVQQEMSPKTLAPSASVSLNAELRELALAAQIDLKE